MDAGEITLVLQRIEHGEEPAADQLLPLVYQDLRRLAAARMAHERTETTLQPTALVHEAWLRLGGDHQPAWESRAQFFAAAAEAMRRILIDRARRRLARRHGGGCERVALHETDIPEVAADARVLRLNDVLEEFAVAEPDKARLVKLRYFTGLTLEETALALGISEPTARRWWTYSRAWLMAALRDPET